MAGPPAKPSEKQSPAQVLTDSGLGGLLWVNRVALHKTDLKVLGIALKEP